MTTKDLAEKDIDSILKKYGLRLHYRIEFPIYKELPPEVKLSLEVLKKHSMRITLELKNAK